MQEVGATRGAVEVVLQSARPQGIGGGVGLLAPVRLGGGARVRWWNARALLASSREQRARKVAFLIDVASGVDVMMVCEVRRNASRMEKERAACVGRMLILVRRDLVRHAVRFDVAAIVAGLAGRQGPGVHNYGLLRDGMQKVVGEMDGIAVASLRGSASTMASVARDWNLLRSGEGMRAWIAWKACLDCLRQLGQDGQSTGGASTRWLICTRDYPPMQARGQRLAAWTVRTLPSRPSRSHTFG